MQGELSVKRCEILKDYCRTNSLVASLAVTLCQGEAQVTVVVPAYNEEAFLGATIASLGAITDPIEIVIVDNGSTDKTKEVASKSAQTIRWPVTILDCLQKGPVNARKISMDEVIAQYSQTSPDASRPHYIGMIDADTTVPSNWVEIIVETFRATKASAVGGVHDSPRWIDEQIEAGTGIKSFFSELSQVAFYLTKHGYVQVQTKGANVAIEVAAYAEIGGSKQPTNIAGEFVKGSDRLFGQALRARGYKVAFLPVMTVSSPRRPMFSLIQRKDTSHYSLMANWVDCRADEAAMIKEAIDTLSHEEWMKNKLGREVMYVHHNIMIPILRGELSYHFFEELMGKKHDTALALKKKQKDARVWDVKSINTDKVARKLGEEFASQIFDIARGMMSANQSIGLD